MDYKEEMELSYKFFAANAPIVENPNLNKELSFVEQLVSCSCSRNYRVFVNGEHPISDTKMDGVFCPNCGTAAEDFVRLSGHSAGCFNATISRLNFT